MALRHRIASWVFVAVLAAAPVLALAAPLCGGCCCSPAPCHEGAAPCEATVATVPCCDEALPVLPTALKRSGETPSLGAAVPERWLPLAEAPAPVAWPRAVDPDARSSPLRLSVVLRI